MELHAQTLNRFCHQHKIIKHYIDNLPPEAIYNRLNPEKWSIHEIIAYLSRYQYIFMDRLKTIITEINPFFEIYRPDDDPQYSFTVAKTTGSLLHELYRLRDEMMQMLEKMPAVQCSRVGTHAILGRMNVSQWLEFFLLHESNQLYKIFKLAGSFWSSDKAQDSHIISLPRLRNQIDELA